MIEGTLKNCPECRNIDCTCPKQIGALQPTPSSPNPTQEQEKCECGLPKEKLGYHKCQKINHGEDCKCSNCKTFYSLSDDTTTREEWSKFWKLSGQNPFELEKKQHQWLKDLLLSREQWARADERRKFIELVEEMKGRNVINELDYL